MNCMFIKILSLYSVNSFLGVHYFLSFPSTKTKKDLKVYETKNFARYETMVPYYILRHKEISSMVVNNIEVQSSLIKADD